jgi:hypothetical protein
MPTENRNGVDDYAGGIDRSRRVLSGEEVEQSVEIG